MLKFLNFFNFLRKIPILKEFEWFEWFEWFGPSPIEPFNSGGVGCSSSQKSGVVGLRRPAGRAARELESAANLGSKEGIQTLQ